MHSKEIVQTLSNTHRRMEHVLTLVRLQVDALKPTNDVAGYRFLKNAYGYMHNFPGLMHHPTEEILFTRLVVCAPETQALCGRLAGQHKDFGHREVVLMRHIRELQSGAMGAFQRIKELGVSYCKQHADHIQSEELELIPQALKSLTEEDWKGIGAHTKELVDPLLEGHALERFDNLYDFLMEANGKFDVH